jgi:hypothetical protein
VQHEGALFFACDLPATVMELHVVEAAEQNAAVNIGVPLVCVPLINVMGFAV